MGVPLQAQNGNAPADRRGSVESLPSVVKSAPPREEPRLTGSPDEAPKQSKLRIILFFALFLFVPGAVLFTTGVVERNACYKNTSSCQAHCATTFDDDGRHFQSHFQGERECKHACQAEGEDCMAKGMSVMAGGLTLSFGLVCASSLVMALDALGKRYGGASDVLEIRQPRPAYMEPVLTEGEKRKMKNNSLLNKRVVHEMPCLVEAKCEDCGVTEYVDVRWRSCEWGGMEGVICHRCKQVIVGVL